MPPWNPDKVQPISQSSGEPLLAFRNQPGLPGAALVWWAASDSSRGGGSTALTEAQERSAVEHGRGGFERRPGRRVGRPGRGGSRGSVEPTEIRVASPFREHGNPGAFLEEAWRSFVHRYERIELRVPDPRVRFVLESREVSDAASPSPVSLMPYPWACPIS